MLVISSGLVITLSAHGVELLLEHQSIWSLSSESVARIAFALRNDVTVRSLAPSSKVALPTARVGLPIRTLLVICVTIVPLSVISFAGCLVQHEIVGSITNRFAPDHPSSCQETPWPIVMS